MKFNEFCTVNPDFMNPVIVALRLSRVALAHSVPGDCFATGPLTGDPIEDLVVCPGCLALEAVDKILDATIFTREEALNVAPMKQCRIPYSCAVHGNWDASRESGCPQCVAAMRRQLGRYRMEVDTLIEVLENAHSCATLEGDGRCAGCFVSEALEKAKGRVKPI